MSSDVRLHIGNKNYSSWSLRPWLALRWADVSFTESIVQLGGPLYGQGKTPELLAVSPTGRVPTLLVGDTTIWDSLAICEWAAEQATAGHKIWPENATSRALARAATCEMHSGFAALRRDLSMNIRRRVQGVEWPEDTRRDITRVLALWTELRMRFAAEGSYLCGSRSIADAFFTPVATRFRTYGVELTGVCQNYADTLLADDAFKEWEREAIAETWTLAPTDLLYSA